MNDGAGLVLVENGEPTAAYFQAQRAHRRENIPILRRHGVYAMRWGMGNDERFASIFRGVFTQLPLYARRAILWHWKNHILASCFGPRIALVSSCDGEKRNVWAGVKHGGYQMLFNASIFDRMPEEHAAELCAHELAHVFQHARKITFESEGETEEHADLLMSEWGFAPLAMNLWAQRHIWRWRRGRPQFRKHPLSESEAKRQMDQRTDTRYWSDDDFEFARAMSWIKSEVGNGKR